MATYRELFKEAPSADLLGKCYINALEESRDEAKTNSKWVVVSGIIFFVTFWFAKDKFDIAYLWTFIFFYGGWFYTKQAKEIQEKIDSQRHYLEIEVDLD